MYASPPHVPPSYLSTKMTDSEAADQPHNYDFDSDLDADLDASESEVDADLNPDLDLDHDSSPSRASSPASIPELPTGEFPTVASLTGLFISHLECSIHTILYARGIYPARLFMASRMYGAAVKMCRVPAVNRFVRELVDTVGEQMLAENVRIVAVVVLSPGPLRAPLERFCFDVGYLPRVGGRERHTLLVAEDGITDLPDLHAQFRSLMMQLASVAGRLGRLPEGCSFTVALELEEGGVPIEREKRWVVEDPKMTNGTVGTVGTTTVTLRSIVSGAMNLDVWVEESGAKAKLPVA
ncbi:DNA-binding protein [Tricharina praecox]|uniref:DNA-binding protein n=1 Tax=Tricharina praecox TaxID=43433 RepID=UPI00221FBC29|nr:DNA-binding protein [Tricharina praecox]KAI5852284.1 DNA-binding protein [Tricharina praecox]